MDSMAAAGHVARLLASAPGHFGGVHLHGPGDTARDDWLAGLRGQLAPDIPWLRIPAGAGVDALLGGLDLSATLALGRPQARPGLLARADGGFLLLPMAERADPGVLSCLQQALDQGCVRVEREGLHHTAAARFCLIALDEAIDERDGLPASLLDRLAFSLDTRSLRQPPASADVPEPAALPGTDDSPEQREQLLAALCAGAWQLGIDSLRAPIQALAAARTLAALEGREHICQADVVLAASLVYSARARQLPAGEEDAEPPPPESADTAETPPPATEQAAPPPADPLSAQSPPPPPELPDGATERVVEGVVAALPPDLLMRLATQAAQQGSGRAATRPPRRKTRVLHGRPVGSRAGDPRRGLPLDLLATVRTALPWQKLRRAPLASGARLSIRTSDLQVRRLKPRTRSTAVFAVDASGSAALHRLNEAKGAVATLLAQCYVRRDQVALVSFRGAGAELRLPPTRSLARVHRELAALPGGGGTPLASGLAMAGKLGSELRRRGEAPLVVLLTDGRANVSRDGIGGRARAEQEAFAEAAALCAAGVPALLVDISPQPQERARLLARTMGAEYLALPAAGAERLASAVARRMPGQRSQAVGGRRD